MADKDSQPRSNPVESFDAYHYQALDPTRKEFRLLTFLPGQSNDDEIKCILQYARLGDAPTYDCLSYTWGEVRRSRRISIDDTPLGVTENLEAALHQLQRRYNCSQSNNPAFWIDAICIDQDNEAERNEQVQRMIEIFYGADMFSYGWDLKVRTRLSHSRLCKTFPWSSSPKTFYRFNGLIQMQRALAFKLLRKPKRDWRPLECPLCNL